MPWLLTSPGHQQPWYWLCKTGRFLSYLRKDFNYLRRINVEKWHKCNYMFMFPLKNLACKGYRKMCVSLFVQCTMTASNVNCWADISNHVVWLWQAGDTENFERLDFCEINVRWVECCHWFQWRFWQISLYKPFSIKCPFITAPSSPGFVKNHWIWKMMLQAWKSLAISKFCFKSWKSPIILVPNIAQFFKVQW